MKRLIIVVLLLNSLFVAAQPKTVKASVPVAGQEAVELEFAFADDIEIRTWDKNEVFVEVMVEINEGEDNDIFSLTTHASNSTIYVEMDEDMWKKLVKGEKWKHCSYSATINYTVYLPNKLKVRANTISGDYQFEYFGSEMDLKTISGAIDVTIPEEEGLDFKAETISGEIYSNIEIEFLDAKKGLRQIVGQKVRGRINLEESNPDLRQ